MTFKSLLSPPAAIGTALGTAGLVMAIYALTVPNVGVIHATTAHDTNVDAARRKAAIAGAFAAGAITLLSKDMSPLILGGGAVIISDIYVRHANAVHPVTGQLVATTEYGPPAEDSGQPYAADFTQ